MIAPGRVLASFEVLSPLGAGGMGEVYRARDRRLGREVALKVLPAAVSAQPVRLARFEAEARALAALADPGIAAIFGVEEDQGVRFLVLELVPGETLAERLARGAMAPREAAAMARQVAAALEAAHRKGIVHRDLKCANIKLTPGGAVKVLDFGLAKALADGDGGDHDDRVTRSDAAGALTGEGTIVGTAAYMSPEQARGLPVDGRTDIWSFGCVLYQALTGRPAFRGATFSDTLAAVLVSRPDWTALPPDVPEGLRRLLQRCLEPDRARRLHHIADARIELDELLASPAAPAAASRSRQRLATAAAAVGAAALLATGWLLWTSAVKWSSRRSAEPAAPPGAPAAGRPRPRLLLGLPPSIHASDLDSGQTTLALSPDGARLVFAAGPSGSRRLYHRPLDELDARPIPGTEGGDNPFFSPDGQWLGFHLEDRLMKVRIDGGEPLVLAEIPGLRGASWGADDTIVYAPSAWSGLSRIAATGGPPRVITTPDPARGEISHRWPQLLPDGKTVLFSIMTASGREDERRIAVVAVDGGAPREVLRGGTAPRLLPSGHLLYARGSTLHAAPFDPVAATLRGPAVAVLDGVLVLSKSSGAAYFDVARDGTLVYVPADPRQANRALVWADRRGRLQPLPVADRPYAEPALSPDGRRLAVTIQGATDDIWTYDLDRATWTRLTFEGDNGCPVWSPDGKRLAFTSTRRGPRNIYWMPADGSGPAEQLTRSHNWQNIVFYGADGRSLFFTEQEAVTSSDVWVLPLDGERRPRPLLATSAIELFPALSPDGRWLAYTSTESRRDEVYVRPHPGPGRKWAISRDGGSQPSWAADGRELYYRSGDRMMVVPVRSRPTFAPGAPRVLFTVPFDLGGVVGNYSASPDGQRFLMVGRADRQAAPPRLVAIPGWFDELAAKLRERR